QKAEQTGLKVKAGARLDAAHQLNQHALAKLVAQPGEDDRTVMTSQFVVGDGAGVPGFGDGRLHLWGQTSGLSEQTGGLLPRWFDGPDRLFLVGQDGADEMTAQADGGTGTVSVGQDGAARQPALDAVGPAGRDRAVLRLRQLDGLLVFRQLTL